MAWIVISFEGSYVESEVDGLARELALAVTVYREGGVVCMKPRYLPIGKSPTMGIYVDDEHAEKLYAKVMEFLNDDSRTGELGVEVSQIEGKCYQGGG